MLAPAVDRARDGALYPEPTPWRRWLLPTTDGHRLQVTEWGSPQGQPALLLHGGPGSGCSPTLARFLDPARYRIIGLDQRGAGGSTPAGDIRHNSTDLLLADLRALRHVLGVGRWLVVGGSWGATLALAHALDAPDAVAALLLRGLFLPRREAIERFFDGATRDRPQVWARWQQAAQAAGRDLIDQLAGLLQTGTPAEQEALVGAWWRWEQSLQSDDDPTAAPLPPLDALLARYRVQSHYLRHRCWLDAPPLLDRLHGAPRVPTLLLHGVLDRVCEPRASIEAQRRLAGSRLQLVDGAGHAPTHPAMAAAMVRALDHYARHGRFVSAGDAA